MYPRLPIPGAPLLFPRPLLVDAIAQLLLDAILISPEAVDVGDVHAWASSEAPELPRAAEPWGEAIRLLIDRGEARAMQREHGGSRVTEALPGARVSLLALARDADPAWQGAIEALRARGAKLGGLALILHRRQHGDWVWRRRGDSPRAARIAWLGATIGMGWALATDRMHEVLETFGAEPACGDGELIELLQLVPPQNRWKTFRVLNLDALRVPWFGSPLELAAAWPDADGTGSVGPLVTARVFAGALDAAPTPASGGAHVWAALLQDGAQAGEEAAARLLTQLGVRVNSVGGLHPDAAVACALALGLSADGRRRALAHKLAEHYEPELGIVTTQVKAGGVLRTYCSRRPADAALPLENIVRAREGEQLLKLGPVSQDLLTELVLGLAERFAGRTPSPERHRALAEAAADLGLRRLALEHTALAGDAAPGATLTRLWGAAPAWEQQLGRFAAGLGISIGDTLRSRVVWTITLAESAYGLTGHLVPRLQVPDKKGKHSSGRELKLTARGFSDVREATRQDTDAAELVALSRSPYTRPAQQVELQRAALARLAGHPYLFDGLGRPVRVRTARVTVQLRRVAGGLELTPSVPAGAPPLRLVAPGLIEVRDPDTSAFDVLRALGPGLVVPDEGVEVLRGIMPALAARVAVEDLAGLTEELGAAEVCAGDPRPVLQLRPAGSGVAVRICARPAGPLAPAQLPGRGPAALLLRVDGGLKQVVRRLDEEQAQLAALVEAVPALAGLEPGMERDLTDPWAALELLEAVSAAGDRAGVEWPEGKALRIKARVDKRALQIKWTVVGDWFAAEGGLQLPGGQLLELTALLDAMRAGARGFAALGSGEFLALSTDLRQRLERLSRARRGDAGQVQVHPLAMSALEGLIDGAEVDPAAAERLARLKAEAAAPPAFAPTLAGVLRPYQLAGVGWMHRLTTLGVGALLADDMGLGKTLQALALLSARAAAGPGLVLAPASVVGGWLEQAARFTPWLRVHRLDDLPRGPLKVGPGALVVCSYGLLPHHGERLAALPWGTLVIDEAQAIKNADTQRHQLVSALRAGARVALSGTPVENHLTELWALSEVLNPGLLGAVDHFRRRFAEPIADGDEEAKAQLRALIRPLVLRRTKVEVVPELPPRIEVNVPVALGPEEALAYSQLHAAVVADISAQGADAMRVLVGLTRLRQAACHPSLVDPALAALPSAKLDALADLLEHLVENDHRALIFSQFTAHLDRAEALLGARGVPTLRLDGAVPARERDRRVKAFQAGEGRAFLISLRAGGAGLNLTGADHVIHLDPWWNPAVEDQASDRAHRIGQTKPVTIYRLIAQGTVEEKILRLHGEKRALADQLLVGADAASGLAVPELLALIGEGVAAAAPARAKPRRGGLG